MLEKLKRPALWLAMLGLVKLFTQAVFGIELPDELVNEAANGVAAIFTIVGILVDHGKRAG